MSTETERQEFEAWASEKGYPLDLILPDHPDKQYAYAVTSAAWDSWQAAKASEAAPEATHMCITCGAYWKQHEEGWNLRSETCGECCDNEPMDNQIVALPSTWKERALKAEAAWAENETAFNCLADEFNSINGPTQMGEPVLPDKASEAGSEPVAYGVFFSGVLQEFAYNKEAAEGIVREESELDKPEISVSPLYTHPAASVSAQQAEAEPVGWMMEDRLFKPGYPIFTASREAAKSWETSNTVFPVYTTPPAPAPVVPKMKIAAEDKSPSYAMGWNDCRAEMLAARIASAPQPEKKDGP